MDSYEASRVVFSRIQSFDPENASKIMGLLLIQDHGEKEMIRLAFGPESLVHSVILKARKDLGLINTSNNSPNSSSSSSSPSSTTPITISRQNSSSTTSRLSITITNPSHEIISSPHEDNNSNNLPSNPSSLSTSSLPFYSHNHTMDEFQLQDQLSFLNENNLSPTNDMPFSSSSYWPSSPSSIIAHHRRSCSVSDTDMCLAAEDPSSGFGWKPCLYYARGFCKNGTSCRFLHGDDSPLVGSPSNNLENTMIDHHHHHDHHNQCHHHHHNHQGPHELLRSKSVQQQRLVSASQQLMANSFPYSPKCMNLLLHQQNEAQRSAATALMMSNEELHKFGRSRLERNEFAMNGCVNPASRQIYLTFPADSTFREEDVSNYFSIYGPVQDVRIPYQQKRMFGFVTFVYAETVKLILAKGNPHFVCDARVLVKPYKEKGKVQDKKQQQQSQVERGDFSPCGTPTGLDSRDPFDLQLGARMFYNSQDMLWRRKLEEQAEFQQALELQSRRLMSLQLLDVKKHHHRALSTGSPIQSPTQSPNVFSQNQLIPLDQNCPTPTPNSVALEPQLSAVAIGKESPVSHDENGNDKESSHDEIGDLLESLEHNLPDSPFASPTKAEEANYGYMNTFSGHNEANDLSNNMNLTTTTSLLPSSSLDMASFKSFNCQLPRFSSGHGAIGVYAGTAGGPKCPVGI